MGVPGCPDLACCTASMERVRIVLIHSWSAVAPVSGSATSVLIIVSCALSADCLRFHGSDLGKSAQVPLGLTEPGRQEGLDKIPRYSRPHSPAAHTNNVHVVVLDALPGREVVVDQTGADAWNFVRANRRPHPTTADRNAAFYFPSSHRPSQRNDKVGVVVARRQRGRAILNYLVPRRAKIVNQLFLQVKPAVISGDSYSHAIPLFCAPR